ncbi:hypothetical protein RF11_13899 [Thelohanellus kitauei]|uniref:Uncharacterized protein n=1 Tax=Thelohanellus kitauei TaxID=669202 RepID=A0A0C2MGX2_THEKT|nr:hypothetical protein RF11_13899 [Thelohanellus kitauei]
MDNLNTALILAYKYDKHIWHSLREYERKIFIQAVDRDGLCELFQKNNPKKMAYAVSGNYFLFVYEVKNMLNEWLYVRVIVFDKSKPWDTVNTPRILDILDTKPFTNIY